MLALVGMCAAGAITALVYDFFKMMRMAFKKGVGKLTPCFAVQVQDALFWVISLIVFLLALYICNGGIVRWYIIASYAAGIALYHFLLTKISGKIIFFLFLAVIYIIKMPFLLFSVIFRKKKTRRKEKEII